MYFSVLIPSHVEIRSNAHANSAAKSALTLNISSFKLPFTDSKGLINETLNSFWQSSWYAVEMAPFFQEQSPGRGGISEMQKRSYLLDIFLPSSGR